MKHGKKNINKKVVIPLAVVVAVLVFGVIYASCVKLINLTPYAAQPNNFTVGDVFDISIKGTSITYEEPAEADNININLNVKNNADGAYQLISCFYINAKQDGSSVLIEPEISRSDGLDNNTSALAQFVKSEESVDLMLNFRLANYSDVHLIFYAFPHNEKTFEPVDVVLPVHKTVEVWWNEICNWWTILGKQNVPSVSIANFEIPLADGWYADTSATVVSVFKNPKFPDAQISMGAASSMQAKALAEQTAQMAGANIQVQSFDIKGKTYWGYTTDNGFVLCLDGEDGLALRIYAQNITLDQAQPLLP